MDIYSLEAKVTTLLLLSLKSSLTKNDHYYHYYYHLQYIELKWKSSIRL